MRFSTTTLLALAAPLLALAQTNSTSSEPNAFNNPLGGYAPRAGDVTTIKWNPTTSGTVTIVLRSGAASNLIAGTVVASSIPNSGSYDWTVPSDITRGSDYALEIVDDSDPSVVNFTPQFVIESPNTIATTTNPVTLGAVTSSAASGSASDSSMTGSSTGSAASASTTGSITGSSSGSATGSMTTSASGSASSRAASASASASDVVLTTSSQAAGARATAMAGMLGVVALGALAL